MEIWIIYSMKKKNALQLGTRDSIAPNGTEKCLYLLTDRHVLCVFRLFNFGIFYKSPQIYGITMQSFEWFPLRKIETKRKKESWTNGFLANGITA